jgi:hypothetical protein
MALSLRELAPNLSPEDMPIYDQMLMELGALAGSIILGGVAVDPQFAVGLEDPKQLKSSANLSYGEAAFTGRFCGLSLIDFTRVLKEGELMAEPQENTLVSHGLIFEVDPRLENFHEGNLGVASLMPYVAVLPGSLYQITRLTFA